MGQVEQDNGDRTKLDSAQSSILILSRKCAQLFVQAAQNVPEELQIGVENQKGRFQIWGGHLGVFAPGMAGLDWCLKDDPELKEVFCSILHRLESRLEVLLGHRLPVTISHWRRPMEDGISSSDVSSSSTDMSLDEDAIIPLESEEIKPPAIKGVEDLITLLYRFSAMIKKSKSDTEQERVFQFMKKHGSDSNVEHFEAYVDWHIQQNFPQLTESPVIAKRLAKAAVQRRWRLLYRQQHYEKLKANMGDWFIPRNPESVLQPLLSSMPDKGKAPLNIPSVIEPKQSTAQTVQFAQPHSATIASSMKKLAPVAPPKSIAPSQVTRSAIARREQLDIPAPPKSRGRGVQEVMCPYCCQPVGPEIIGTGKTDRIRWARHIIRDTRPYVCLFNKCDQPDEQYQTVDEWLHHMYWRHMLRWFCQVEGHQEIEYPSAAGLQSHMTEHHADTFSELGLPSLLEHASRPSGNVFATLIYVRNSGEETRDTIEECLLCAKPAKEIYGLDFDPVDLQGAEPDHPLFQKIKDHLASHLEAFALLSLPEDSDMHSAASNRRVTDGPGSINDRDAIGIPSIHSSDSWRPDRLPHVDTFTGKARWEADQLYPLGKPTELEEYHLEEAFGVGLSHDSFDHGNPYGPPADVIAEHLPWWHEVTSYIHQNAESFHPSPEQDINLLPFIERHRRIIRLWHDAARLVTRRRIIPPNQSTFQRRQSPPRYSIGMSEIVGDKWALLIGINHYPKGPTSRLDIEGRPIEYNNLNGCVQDILEVEQFLLETMKVEESHILKLLAPTPEDDGLCERANRNEGKPTYKNITNALKSITYLAKPGDMVYIHYSGHGARATTIFPKLKSGTEWDDAFVPTDIVCGGQYLRDLEVALFLKRMVDKNLVVTVILDCCHSGGAVRNAMGGTVRAVKGYYKSVLPEDLPDSFGEIERNGSLMLREPEGFTLFAACLPHEQAREVIFDDGRVHGVFTYCLLQTLRHGLSQMPSSRALYQRVCGRVRDEFVDQTPFFAGEIDRLFFSADVIAQINTISVRRISSPQRVGDELDLAGGTAHGVHIGSVYAVYPFGTVISGTGAMRVVVKEVLSLISVATIVELSDANIGNIEPGCPAVLLRLPFEEKFQVAFFSREAATMEKFARDWEIHKGNDGWLQLVTGTENHALSSFHVTTNDRGEYEIGDSHGILLPNIAPPLPFLLAGEPTAMPKLIGRIQHLAQFSAVKKIDNPDGTSNLRGSLSLELSGVSSTQYEEAGAEYRVRNRERINLYVGNRGLKVVYFALFNLAPLFGISQIYPVRTDFECLEPGQERMIPLRMGIPPQLMQGVPQPVSVLDILKIFVTLEPASFRSLELPAIDSAELSGSGGGTGIQDGLQRLLAIDSAELSGSGGGTNIQNGLQRLLHRPRENAIYVEDIGDWQIMEVRVRIG